MRPRSLSKNWRKLIITGPFIFFYYIIFMHDHVPQHLSHNFEVRSFDFDNDVLVFLHIQKTGGLFMENYLQFVDRPYQDCPWNFDDCQLPKTNLWIFHRRSAGMPCGDHLNWIEFNDGCVDAFLDSLDLTQRQRRYQFFTILRNPRKRFISEWYNILWGQTWKLLPLRCNGKNWKTTWPLCFKGKNWNTSTIEEFVSCPYNLARNRQTRTLANLSLIGCYGEQLLSATNLTSIPPDQPELLSQPATMLLDSAKNTLVNEFRLFLVNDYLIYSQYVFHRTFNNTLIFEKLLHRVDVFNDAVKRNEEPLPQITAEQEALIDTAVKLDIILYQYAMKIFIAQVRRFILEEKQVVNLRTEKERELLTKVLFNIRQENDIWYTYLTLPGPRADVEDLLTIFMELDGSKE